MEPGALVNEAFLRLIGSTPVEWTGRFQFYAYFSTTMRRIMMNHLRGQASSKRGGKGGAEPLDESIHHDTLSISRNLPAAVDLLDLDTALTRLAALSSRQAQVVEMRYFGDLTVPEISQVLGISERTVKREWHTARLFLLRTLSRSRD